MKRIVQNLARKYLKDAKLACNELIISKRENDTEYEHEFVGHGCKATIAGFEIDVPGVEAKGNVKMSGLNKYLK